MALVRKDKVQELRASVVVPSRGKDEVAITDRGQLCRLKTNMILGDGKLHPRGEVIDDRFIPQHYRMEDYVDYNDLSGKEGKVLVLLQIVYSGRPSLDGVSYPVTVMQGEVVTLDDIPPRARELLVEGTHYQSEFTDEDIARVKHKAQAQQDKYYTMKGSSSIGGFWRK